MTDDEQHHYDTRLQPKDLEEAKVWIAQMRTQIDFYRNVDAVWKERMGKLEDRISEGKYKASLLEDALARERKIVDFLISKSRYD